MKLFLVVLLFGVNVTLTIAQTSEGKVFLYGGGIQDNTASIYNALLNATGKPRPTIAVAISAAGSLEAGLEAYYVDEPGSLSYQRLFTFYGFRPSVINLAMDNYQEGSSNLTELGRENIRLVENADVIFFNGGDQSRHSRSWFNSDGSDSDIMVVLRQRFSAGAIVAGTSAGSAIMGDFTYGEGYSYGYYYFNADLKPCAIGETLVDDREGTDSFRYDENGGYMKGFGFVNDALVDSHFDQRGRFGRLPTAMRSTGNVYGFGVGEDTLLAIDGVTGVATVYGNDGAWFVDSSKANFTSTDAHFNGRNIRVSYLTEGDSINLITKEVISTKQEIPAWSGVAYNSQDIFYRTEGIRSIKALVTSTSSQSVGLSYEMNPRTKVTFYKGRGELAYLTNEKYTVDKLLMDIGTI